MLQAGTLRSPALPAQEQGGRPLAAHLHVAAAASQHACRDAGLRVLLAAATAMVSTRGVPKYKCVLSDADLAHTTEGYTCEAFALRLCSPAGGQLSRHSSWDH